MTKKYARKPKQRPVYEGATLVTFEEWWAWDQARRKRHPYTRYTEIRWTFGSKRQTGRIDPYEEKATVRYYYVAG